MSTLITLTSLDLAELIRLKANGKKRVVCDVDGQRAAFDDHGNFEMVADGLLLFVQHGNALDIDSVVGGR